MTGRLRSRLENVSSQGGSSHDRSVPHPEQFRRASHRILAGGFSPKTNCGRRSGSSTSSFGQACQGANRSKPGARSRSTKSFSPHCGARGHRSPANLLKLFRRTPSFDENSMPASSKACLIAARENLCGVRCSLQNYEWFCAPRRLFWRASLASSSARRARRGIERAKYPCRDCDGRFAQNATKRP